MNQKTISLLLAALALLTVIVKHQQGDNSSLYNEWKETYGQTWEESEDDYRKIIF